ncbi:hypothetical protein [Streptomyces tubercidicus]|nr:hypothetical protein [Streptomyces tubercidicus]WAU10011.1 hypothetical protein STRTU_000052 [Streptomyces tubercidicus]
MKTHDGAQVLVGEDEDEDEDEDEADAVRRQPGAAGAQLDVGGSLAG